MNKFFLLTFLSGALSLPSVGVANYFTFYNNNLQELHSNDAIQFKLSYKPPYGGYTEIGPIRADFGKNSTIKYLGSQVIVDYDIYIRDFTTNSSYKKCGSGRQYPELTTTITGSSNGSTVRCTSST